MAVNMGFQGWFDLELRGHPFSCSPEFSVTLLIMRFLLAAVDSSTFILNQLEESEVNKNCILRGWISRGFLCKIPYL